MYPYLNIGPLLIQTAGLVSILGLWLASLLTEREARRLNLNLADLNALMFLSLVAGVIGARLGYALRYLDAYLQSPLSLFSLNTSTLSAFDGVALGLVVGIIVAVRKNIPFRPLLDSFAPGLALFLAAQGAAHFLSGSAYGAPTSQPWSIFLWGEYRHPTQVYETVLSLAVLGLALWKPLGRPGSGLNFVIVAALSALSRVFLEAFRGDSDFIAGGFRPAQLAALGIFAICLVVAHRWMSEPPAEEQRYDEQPSS